MARDVRPPKKDRNGMETITVVENLKEKKVRPPTLVNTGMAIGFVVGAAAGFFLPFTGSMLVAGAVIGSIGGWIRKRKMISEYADAMDFRDRERKPATIEKPGRSAEKMRELEKNGGELDHSSIDYERSQLEALERRQDMIYPQTSR